MKKPNIKRHEWQAHKMGDEYYLMTRLDVGEGRYHFGTIHSADHNSLEDTAKAISAVPDMIDALMGMCREYRRALDRNFDYIDDLDEEYFKSICALKKAGVEL